MSHYRRILSAGAHDKPIAVSSTRGDLPGYLSPQLFLTTGQKNPHGVKITQNSAVALHPGHDILDYGGGCSQSVTSLCCQAQAPAGERSSL